MSKLVTIYGGSGFVGRHVASAMARKGWRVRVAVRRPNQALYVRTYGVVGQVDPVACNIRDDISVRAAMTDADAVINCVGIMNRQGRNRFDSVHEEGAGRIARIAAETGVADLVHVSAIGANEDSRSNYAASKGRGEAAILAAFPQAVIVRPSVIFGPDDSFFNKLAGIAAMSPIAAVVGARTQVQPVFVGDVADAVAMAACGEVGPGIYELGGPERMTMREAMALVVATIQRRRMIMGLPAWFAAIIGGGLDLVQTLTGGLVTNSVLTRDQVRLLAYPNVVSEDAQGFEAFGIAPIAAETVLEDYLWRFRVTGEYAAINESASRLRQRG